MGLLFRNLSLNNIMSFIFLNYIVERFFLLTVYRNDERYVNSYYKAFSGQDYCAIGDYGIED